MLVNLIVGYCAFCSGIMASIVVSCIHEEGCSIFSWKGLWPMAAHVVLAPLTVPITFVVVIVVSCVRFRQRSRFSS